MEIRLKIRCLRVHCIKYSSTGHSISLLYKDVLCKFSKNSATLNIIILSSRTAGNYGQHRTAAFIEDIKILCGMPIRFMCLPVCACVMYVCIYDLMYVYMYSRILWPRASWNKLKWINKVTFKPCDPSECTGI